MANISHDIDSDISSNLIRACPCGNSSFLSFSCFLHAQSQKDKVSRNAWLAIMVVFLLFAGFVISF